MCVLHAQETVIPDVRNKVTIDNIKIDSAGIKWQEREATFHL